VADAAAPARPLRHAVRLADQLRAELEAARTRVGEHESMMKLLQQKNTSLAAKLEAEQAETARLRKAHDKLRRHARRVDHMTQHARGASTCAICPHKFAFTPAGLAIGRVRSWMLSVQRVHVSARGLPP